MNKKRIITTACVPLLAALLAWVGGYDFDARGGWQAYVLGMTIFAALGVWFHPGWTE